MEKQKVKNIVSKKKVKVVVTPVYVGNKPMNEVFSNVIIDMVQKNEKVS